MPWTCCCLILCSKLFLAVSRRTARPPARPPYKYLVRREGSRQHNQSLLLMRPREASPHQTKRARPHCTSLGLFNSAGYAVLMTLFLTSQILFLALSSSSSLSLLLFHCVSLQTFSSVSHHTFVLSSPFRFKSVTSSAALYCLYFSLCVSCTVSH